MSDIDIVQNNFDRHGQRGSARIVGENHSNAEALNWLLAEARDSCFESVKGSSLYESKDFAEGVDTALAAWYLIATDQRPSMGRR